MTDGMDALFAALGVADYRQCVNECVRALSQDISTHVQIDRRLDCTWIDAWDEALLVYVGRDGRRILRERMSDATLRVLHEVAS